MSPTYTGNNGVNTKNYTEANNTETGGYVVDTKVIRQNTNVETITGTYHQVIGHFSYGIRIQQDNWLYGIKVP